MVRGARADKTIPYERRECQKQDKEGAEKNRQRKKKVQPSRPAKERFRAFAT